MARQTEVEVEETEVERIYCDECGADCTEDHRVEPKDVCPSCSSRTAVDRITDLTLETDEDERTSFRLMLTLTIIFPLVVALTFLVGPSDDDGPNTEDIKAMTVFIAGSVLWSVGITAFILM